MSQRRECDTIKKNAEGEAGMRNKRFHAGLKKRAVCTGLFLGVLCGMLGCVKPGPAVQPVGTKTPVPSPTEAGSLLPTSTPGGTKTPVPTAGPTKPIPVITATPMSTVTPIPEKTDSPVPTVTITPEPELTATPVPQVTVTPEPEAKGTPKPQITVSPIPDPTGIPEPGVTTMPEPELTATPEPEATTTPEPEVTVTPEPEITSTPEVTSAPMPDYNALLQNGWQRTEDFFGCREIYFSGQFTETELIAEEGHYEYYYRMNGDMTSRLKIIGETALLQEFLDELAQKGTACVILQEEESLYGYVYTEEGMIVKGKVYTCVTEGEEHRMRVEVHYPENEEEKSEVFDFYLR